MAAWKPQKGTYEIDLSMPGIGRVRLRTGTHDKKRAERYEAMLEDLPLDTVRLILDGVLGLRETYDLWSRGEARLLPSAQALRPLLESFTAWETAHEKDVSADESANRAKVRRALVLLRVGPLRIQNVPDVLRAMRETYRTRQSAFNHARAILLAFLRDTVGKRSELHARASDVRSLPTPRKLKRHPCTVQEAKAVRDALPKKWGPVWWALCCTGMGPREYFVNGWEARRDGIAIHGQKRFARERIVPYLVEPPQPPGSEDAFESALSRAGVGVAPYDARRTFARWLQELRLPVYRQDAYLGHGPKSMTELYSWGDIRAWLEEDGKALREYVGEPIALRVRA